MMAAGVPKALVALLVHPNSLTAAKQWACRTLGQLTDGSESSRCQAIVAAGAVPALLQGLVSDSPADVQAAAALALAELTGSPEPEISRSACAAGGVQLLVPLLSSPHEEARRSAVAVLRNLAADSEECRAALAASALPALVQLLRDADPATKANAAHTLTRVSDDQVGHSAAIVQHGALPHLMHLLGRGDAEQQQAAAGAVHALSMDGQAAAAAAAGAVGRLVHLLRRADYDGLMADAALALDSLALEHPECCADAAAAIPSLVSLLASCDQKACSNAAAALAHIVSEDAEAASAAAQHGAVAALVRAAQRSTEASTLQELMWALSQIATEPGAGQQLEAAGGVLLLVQLLRHNDAGVQHSTAWAVRFFAHTIPAQLVAAGAICALLGALHSGTSGPDPEPGLQQAAAEALGQLAAGSLRRSRFIVASGGIAALRPLLDEEEAQRAAAWALRQLAVVEPSALEGVPDASDSESESSWEDERSSGSDEWHSDAGSEQDGPEGGTEEAQQRQQQEQQQQRHCTVCGATRAAGVKLRLCAGCRTPGLLFCSTECQRQAWPSHRAECREAQAAARRKN
ncbi:hypothetical protein COHA_006087 [Chlorella ohadii]|uniref:Vacuolar protein 8 n=1 Tax=Chlorella ohadii TaxID=2649997 RepID=A0AAD5H4V4_9CHLO|nr:hypothetical protein COHA_006087 [Chlorella ohadii]